MIAIDHTTGAVLGQRQVGDKRGEGAAARDLLTGLQAPGANGGGGVTC